MGPEKKASINYLYFGFLFMILTLLALSSILTKQNLGGSQFFFFLYALGQIVLEIAFFISLSLWLPLYFGKKGLALWIGLSFLILFFHLFDGLMDRILDLSVLEALRIFIFDESLENFFYLLDASGISVWIWFAFFGFLLFLPVIGFTLYYATEKITQKKPLLIAHSHFLQAFICIPLALLFWDVSASKIIHPDAYTAFIKSLPWKFTFLKPQSVLLSLKGPLKAFPQEQKIEEWIAKDETVLAKKPNIYLFIVESLREDAITKEIAPHLFQFKQDSFSPQGGISNGNGTHLSWFSIFHSQFPYFWKEAQKKLKKGSPPLALLKKWGYQIHLYTSAQLGYYGMQNVLFGQNLELLDHCQAFHHKPPENAADSDAAALFKLQKDLKENPSLREGQLFLIFWDSTHFDYSLPKDWPPKFSPFAKELAYFKAFQSDKTVRSIKNRYHNSVNYIDHLFGNFLNTLPNREDAIVIFTADHGEEFFEKGHLFHNSHLTKEQIQIPLYLRFGSLTKSPSLDRIISQMDIFPSLFSYLKAPLPPFLEGNSLFEIPSWPFALTARFNAGRTPYEFSIQNKTHKLIAQFQDRNDIFHSKNLQIISVRTQDDQRIFEENIETWVEAEFALALEKLYHN